MPDNAQLLQVKDITTVEQFNTFIKTNPKAVVIFKTSWSGPNKTPQPEIVTSQRVEDLRSELEVEIGLVETDHASRVAEKAGVTSTPYTSAYRDGKPIQPDGNYVGWNVLNEDGFTTLLKGWYE